MGDGFQQTQASEIDLMWLRSNARAYRVRPGSPAEVEAFPIGLTDYPYLKTIIRASDAAAATFAFNGDDPDMWKLTDHEIAGIFDDDLDRLGRVQ